MKMIKLKDLIVEYTVTQGDFIKWHNQARKETGSNDKIPSKTKQMCNEVMKHGFHKLDYEGKKKSKARDPKNLMYQYYAYVQGWGHSKFKGPADWTFEKSDKILQWSFPNAPFMNKSVSKEDKTKLESMVKSGNIDHGFVQALKINLKIQNIYQLMNLI